MIVKPLRPNTHFYCQQFQSNKKKILSP